MTRSYVNSIKDFRFNGKNVSFSLADDGWETSDSDTNKGEYNFITELENLENIALFFLSEIENCRKIMAETESVRESVSEAKSKTSDSNTKEQLTIISSITTTGSK